MRPVYALYFKSPQRSVNAAATAPLSCKQRDAICLSTCPSHNLLAPNDGGPNNWGDRRSGCGGRLPLSGLLRAQCADLLSNDDIERPTLNIGATSFRQNLKVGKDHTVSSAHHMRAGGAFAPTTGAHRAQNSMRSAGKYWLGADRNIALKFPSNQLHVEPATAADRYEIAQFLEALFHRPSDRRHIQPVDASATDPIADPTERLLFKHRGTIAAHVLIRHRMVRWQSVHLPVGQICELAALPEYRDWRLTDHLLGLAERSLGVQGTVLAVSNTSLPELFRPFGWGQYVPIQRYQAGLRPLLREIAVESADWSNPLSRRTENEPILTIRPWRQIELDSIRRLYHQEIGDQVFGSWDRTEQHWRHLMDQKDFSRIYVAAHESTRRRRRRSRGRPIVSPALSPSDVVAYAVVRGNQLLEIAVRDGNASSTQTLLRRICFDVMEQGFHDLTLYGPSDETIDQWFAAAGASACQLEQLDGYYPIGKVINVGKFLESILPILNERLQSTRPKQQRGRPWKLGIRVGTELVSIVDMSAPNEHIMLQVTTTDRAPRNTVTMPPSVFLHLVCGQPSERHGHALSGLHATTKRALQQLAELFPAGRSSWQMWDH